MPKGPPRNAGVSSETGKNTSGSPAATDVNVKTLVHEEESTLGTNRNITGATNEQQVGALNTH
jgi:hypothetical protein